MRYFYNLFGPIYKFNRKVYKKLKYEYNRSGNIKKCNICDNTFRYFGKLDNGSANTNLWLKKLDIVGSDVDNFWCIFCQSHDRERHLFLYFDRLNIWDSVKNSTILHFAPEKNLINKITQFSPKSYIKADLYPKESSIQKIDLIDIPFPNDNFDILICNHVLEHVYDYVKGLTEIYRVLKPGGMAILQTPYSKLLKANFEDNGINTNDLRLFCYGQEDHVRLFSEKHFFQDLIDTGFSLKIYRHNGLFDEGIAYKNGVNKEEDLIMVIKPMNLI